MARAGGDDIEGTVVLPGFGGAASRIEIPDMLYRIGVLLKFFREYRKDQNEGIRRSGERFDDAIKYLEEIRKVIVRGEAPENIDKVLAKRTVAGTVLARVKNAIRQAMTKGDDSPLIKLIQHYGREASGLGGDRIYPL